MLQLTIQQCQQEDALLISELLEDLGALSVTMTDQYDDPILEPEPGSVPLWPHVVLQALFEPEHHDLTSVTCALSAQYPNLTYEIATLQEEDWERVCLVDLKPQRFGERLWICPSWLTPPAPDAVNLILDPGLAFGTGSHPTTALCLTWLAQRNLSQQDIIDYGCGSGILGIAALKLGAKHVYAVDIDEQALQATKNNALTNHLELTSLSIQSPDGLSQPVDLIMANILLTPLMNLSKRFRDLLKKSGTLVVSGILSHQIDSLVKAYQADFNLISSNQEEDWVLLEFKALI